MTGKVAVLLITATQVAMLRLPVKPLRQYNLVLVSGPLVIRCIYPVLRTFTQSAVAPMRTASGRQRG